MRDAILLIHTKLPADVASGIPLNSRIGSISDLYYPYSTADPLNVLRRTANCKCTDPRDRIFAILSMLSEENVGEAIEPDYNKTVSEVYKDAVARWTNSLGNLAILESCSLDRRLEGAPSWVPNLAIPDIRLPFQFCNAAVERYPVFTIKGDVLEVLGLSVARVGEIGPTGFPSIQGDGDIVFDMKSIIEQYLPHDESPPESKRFQSICRVMMSGAWAEQWNPPREDLLPTKDYIHQILSEIHTTGSWPESRSKGTTFLSWAASSLVGRTTFVTEDGRLGLGPQTMQVGDVVAVFLGRGPAIILRPGSSQFHEVVGDAYCDGIMDGEALLGPLPGRWERRTVHDGDMSSPWFSTFVDTDTGVTQPEDPRLGNLPKGWSRKSHENERLWTQFVNESGEVFDKGWDPRLLPEALRERGVNLNFFKLV